MKLFPHLLQSLSLPHQMVLISHEMLCLLENKDTCRASADPQRIAGDVYTALYCISFPSQTLVQYVIQPRKVNLSISQSPPTHSDKIPSTIPMQNDQYLNYEYATALTCQSCSVREPWLCHSLGEDGCCPCCIPDSDLCPGLYSHWVG